MSDAVETTEAPAESAPEGNDTAPQAEGLGATGEHSGGKLHREAARHRARAKDAEAALATAEAKIDAMNKREAEAQSRIENLLRAEVERLANDAGLSMGADVFTLSENTIADYVNDDGVIDHELVAADVAAILQERPLLGKRQAYDPSQGTGGNPGKQSLSWADLLKD